VKRLKSGIIYHGGSIPIPSHLQKGAIELRDEAFHLQAKGKTPKYNIDITIPMGNIISSTAEEKKYYSSVAYMLIIKFMADDGKEEELELEIRSFVRRGRAKYFSRHWADVLSGG